MSLYKRKTVWWVRFTTPDGRRVRRSTGTGDRIQAQEYHDRLKAELWRTARLGEKPKRSWREAVVRWLSETSHKATHETDKYHLRWLDGYLGDLMLDDITKAWKAALKRADIKDFRWHDLRHTWASWHVQQGTPLHVLQELGGWETVDMVRRYAHLAAEHTAQYAERVSRSFAENDHSAGTNLAHAERSDASELV